MKWTNSYRSFGLKTKRSTGLKTIEHKHIDKKPRNVRRSDGPEGETGKPRRHPSPPPGYSPANGTGTAMTAKEKT